MRSILLFVLLCVSMVVSAQPFKLYGLTANGGGSGFGVLYTILSNDSGFQVLHSFGGGAAGARPYGGLTIAGTKLYGTTKDGGSSGMGTIFSFDTLSLTFQKVADFTGSNGAGPQGDLTYYNGKLYGLAPLGGVNNGGTVFAFDPVAGVLTDLFNLNMSTGTNPYGNMTVFNDKLYFVASYGGTALGGAIAVFDPVAGTVNDLYNFPNLTYPHSGMVVLNNLLYGTEVWGGPGTGGIIFSFDPTTNYLADVHDFTQADFLIDIENPSGLTVSNGVLYGAGQNGVVDEDGGGWFSFDPVANNFNQIRWFTGASIDGPGAGNYPLAAPVAVPDGSVVGAVPFGGANYMGVIDINVANSAPEHSFSGADGQQPMYGSLFVGLDPGTPLPIRILRFSGVLTSVGRELDWMASQPAAGGWFQLQRSTDETNFIPIDSVGATTGTASYSYIDNAPLPGVNVAYYRLKMTDVNQVLSYSNIVAIGLAGNGGDSLRLINTAVTGTAFLQYTSAGASSALNLTVVSMSGHIMIQQQLPVSAGINSYSIDASALPKGMYVIHAAGRSIQFMKL
jgi:uncharacterized repeat protein (TIGR03803 family)